MGLDPACWQPQTPDGRLFADPSPGADETSFQVDNTSAAYYSSDLQPVPAPRVPHPRIDLIDILGADFVAPCVDAKRLTRPDRPGPDPLRRRRQRRLLRTPPRTGVKAPVTVGEYTLVKNPIVEFGYLTITHDRVRINLAKGTLS